MRVLVEGPRRVAVDDLALANAAAGRYWFAPDTMRYFRSKVSSWGHAAVDVPGVAFFVSSEKGPHQSRRRYSVRVALDGGRQIETAGEFQQFSTGTAAERAAIHYAVDPSSRPDNVRRMLGQVEEVTP